MSDSVSETAQVEASIDAGLIMRALLGRLWRIGLVTVLLLAVTLMVLLFVPRLYESTTELLIEPRSSVYTSAAGGTTAAAYYVDDAAVSSQMELIKSRDSIRAALDALDLWGHPQFAGKNTSKIIVEVGKNLKVTQERSSRLISIAYRATDPEFAAHLANGIAQTHVQRRAGQQVSDTLDATAWLEQEIAVLRERVVEAERAIADFRVENDLFTGANNLSLTDQQLSNFANQIAAAAERRNAAQSRAQLIRSLLESGQSVIGVSDVQTSSVAQQLSQELGRLQGERAQQAATLLPNHPAIRALDAQIGEINQQISAEGRRVAQALEAQAQIEAELERSLQEELTRLKVTAGSNAVEGVTLAELEREAAAQRELLNAYLLRFTEATARSDMSSALPDVRIVSEAAPAVTPASPKAGLILLAVGLASVLLQVGAVIFSELLSGRALVTRDDEPMPETVAVAAAAAPVPTEPIKIKPAEPAPIVASPVPPVRIEAEIDGLAARALSGVDRLFIIASEQGYGESRDFAERLTAAIIENGQSVAEIDAASGQQGIELGLSDLCAEDADFGDVVHRGNDDRFAFVPWGQGERLTRNIDRAGTLVEALADIYEVVIVVTGKVGVGSSLPLFAQLSGKCVALSSAAGRVETRHEIAALGFDDIQIITTAQRQSDVA
ncbi:MAG TPA: GumC family protein [Pelagibacterium sp.]|uniref:GumC family protein n=1 Tax=Pelagibacterium sp. TaxID=1967288 RepID=UPI002B75C386|nr:GumC family protein [Pelagibacterium sp.]HWJ87516.1 GumC family protein [Pelagibacterium sp.]